MNKDLPIIIKKIFETPDRTIWEGDWLRILNLLLNEANLTVFWNVFLDNIQSNHSSRFSSLTLNKYIKWEVKGFIAQVVKNKINNTQKEKYKSALLKQIVNTIEEHLNTLARLSYKPLKSEARGKKLVYVKGIIKDHSKKIPDVNLLWKLAKNKEGNFLVLDLEIEGISLVSSHKAETMAILRKNKGDFNALLNTFTKSE